MPKLALLLLLALGGCREKAPTPKNCQLVLWDFDGDRRRIVDRSTRCECGADGSLWCWSGLVKTTDPTTGNAHGVPDGLVDYRLLGLGCRTEGDYLICDWSPKTKWKRVAEKTPLVGGIGSRVLTTVSP